jgi:hypothetical protein
MICAPLRQNGGEMANASLKDIKHIVVLMHRLWSWPRKKIAN